MTETKQELEKVKQRFGQYKKEEISELVGYKNGVQDILGTLRGMYE